MELNMNSDSVPVKLGRAVRTRKELLTALERLLKRYEFEQISIADIASEAGVAVGSVYNHFKDKTAFLDALLELRIEVITERLADATEQAEPELPASLAEGVDLAVRSAYAQVMEDAHILRALHTYARLSGAEHPRAKDLAAAAFASVTDFLKRYEAEIGVQDPDEAAKVFNYMLNTAFLDRILLAGGSLPDNVAPDQEALLRALTSMLTAYLTQGPTGD
jgi:AcrR family transcriptional regulator